MEIEWGTDEVVTIPILLNEKDTILGEITLEFAISNQYQVTLRYNNQKIEGRSSNYFHAFQEIRKILEPQGFRFLCYGASLHCYPSGMTLDMGEGNSVYKMTMGRVARKQDMVGTFQTGDDVIPATIEEQRSFFEVWLDSPAEG